MNYRIGNAVCIDEMPDTGRGGQTFAKRTASDASPARAGAASDGISMSAAALRNQPLKRLKTSVPLVPPKPKELEMATSISASRASLAQ